MFHSEDVLAQSGQYRSFAADPQEDFEIPSNGFLGIRFYIPDTQKEVLFKVNSQIPWITNVR